MGGPAGAVSAEEGNMERFFNTAGPCVVSDHYTLPPERRLPELRDIIGRKLYFVLHAARQVGKTTTMRTLAQALTAEGTYAALHTSCEAGQAAGDDVDRAVTALLETIEMDARHQLPEALRPPPFDRAHSGGMQLGDLLARWSAACPRPVVLFLDEIDALLDNSLIAVLRQLRLGYPSRPVGFPLSVGLIGLRDVRDYKVRLRPERDTLGTASPFNIKVKSLSMRDFLAEEVAELYDQHTAETGQPFTTGAKALAFELTQGQPWLVNALAEQTCRYEEPDRTKPITPDLMERAKEQLILERATHLDSLVDRLREERVRRVIEPIVAGTSFAGDLLEDDVRFVEDLGLIRTDGHVRIANPIYRDIIPRVLAWTTQIRIPHETAWYVENGALDIDKLLGGFLDFWCENAEALIAAQPYPEAAPHLVLLAFLQRVVNAGGTIDREYAVGAGRMDLLVRWRNGDAVQREAIEIKVWRDGRPDPLDKGLDQLTGYLNRLGLDEGTLAIFDRRAAAAPPHERAAITRCEHEGKAIRLVRI